MRCGTTRARLSPSVRYASANSIELPPTFTPPGIEPPPSGAPNEFPGFIGTGDFNLDGAADLALWDAATSTLRFEPAPGARDSGLPYPLPVTVAAGWKPVGTPDLNGDGRPDVLWMRTADRVFRLAVLTPQVRREPRFADVAMQPGAIADPNYELEAWGDFDGNGTEDLVWQHRPELLDGVNAPGRVVMWFMRQGANGPQIQCGDFMTPNRIGWEILGPR